MKCYECKEKIVNEEESYSCECEKLFCQECIESCNEGQDMEEIEECHVCKGEETNQCYGCCGIYLAVEEYEESGYCSEKCCVESEFRAWVRKETGSMLFQLTKEEQEQSRVQWNALKKEAH